MSDERRKSDWVLAKEFEDERAKNVVVRVNKLVMRNGNIQFSTQLGFRMQDGENAFLSNFIRYGKDDALLAPVIAELYTDAEEFIVAELDAHTAFMAEEDRKNAIAEQRWKEENQRRQDQKASKKKQYQDNRERRREDNQKRAHGGRG